MQTIDLYQIDTTAIADPWNPADQPGRAADHILTADCPCDRCPNRETCRDQEMACEAFVWWTTQMQQQYRHRDYMNADRTPSKALFRKV